MDTFLLHSGEQEVQKLLEVLTIPHGERVPSHFRGHTIIGWGKFRNEEQRTQMLQPVQAVLRCANIDRRNALLHTYGIKTMSSHGNLANANKEHYPYSYIIPVFQLDALTVFRKKESGLLMLRGGINRTTPYEEIGLNHQAFRVKRAVREAVKAVYALGLDYGVVTVGVPASGHTLILDVDPVPKLDDKLAELFADAMMKYDQALRDQIRNREPVMLGADPEFLLLSKQGKVVAASRYVERQGEVGCDGTINRGDEKLHPLAELRPQPSESPAELTQHVQQTLQTALLRFSSPDLHWVAGGMPVPGFALGGHIHISRVLLHTPLLRALDNYLALPLLLVESEESLRRRPRYGTLGDFRRQPHGGFEYRTLPSWLAAPAIAQGTFALAKLIAENYAHLPRRPLSDPEVNAMYYRGQKQQLLPIVSVLWQDLERLPAYWQYAAELGRLKNLVFQMRTWDEKEDFRHLWNISMPHTVPQHS